jgi:predicted site-specific integrase-resolvase
MREMLTIMAAAARAGVSRRTITHWMEDGLVEYIRTASGAPRIYADTLWRDGNVSPTGGRPTVRQERES